MTNNRLINYMEGIHRTCSSYNFFYNTSGMKMFVKINYLFHGNSLLNILVLRGQFMRTVKLSFLTFVGRIFSYCSDCYKIVISFCMIAFFSIIIIISSRCGISSLLLVVCFPITNFNM